MPKQQPMCMCYPTPCKKNHRKEVNQAYDKFHNPNPPKPNEGVKCLHEHLEKSQDSTICGIYCVDCGDFQSTDTIAELLWTMVESLEERCNTLEVLHERNETRISAQQQRIAELEERVSYIQNKGLPKGIIVNPNPISNE